MKIVCISASNTAYMGENSASTQVCRLIKKVVLNNIPEASVKIIPLMNQKFLFVFYVVIVLKMVAVPMMTALITYIPI